MALNLRLLVGDVYQLGFADAAFDVVHAHQLVQHLADPVAALREMRRVCKPGGLVAVRDADYSAMTWHPPSAAQPDGSSCTTKWPAQTGANPMQDAGCSGGRAPLVSVRSTLRPAPGVSLRPRMSHGGPIPGQSG